MSDPFHPRHPDSPDHHDHRPPEDRDHPATTLRAMTVEYTDRPDQRTICPRDLSRTQLMATWITADVNCFVDLDTMR